MKYFDKFESDKKHIMEQLKLLFEMYFVESVGWGYIDCIIQKNYLDEFVDSLSKLGVAIDECSWWCYVDPSSADKTCCPHGMGGPKSIYFDGWYSELQNPMISLQKNMRESLLNSYDEQLIALSNKEVLTSIYRRLETPFNYTPTEVIEKNKCVMPALWLLVPDEWRRI